MTGTLLRNAAWGTFWTVKFNRRIDMAEKGRIQNNPVFKNTKRKIWLICLAIVGASMIVFSVFLFVTYRAFAFRNVDNQIMNQVEMLEEDIRMIRDKGYRVFPGGLTDTNLPAFRFQVNKNMKMSIFIYRDGELICTSNWIDKESTAAFEEGFESLTSMPKSFKIDAQLLRGCVRTSGEYTYVVCYNVDVEAESIARLALVTLASFLAVAFVSQLFAKGLSDKAMQPIEEMYEKQAEFIQNASHEMRTPLAVIKGKIELLALHPKDAIEEHYGDISQVMTEIVSMEKMNRNLLILSKEDVAADLSLEAFKISDLTNGIDEFFSDLSEVKNIDFKIHVPSQELEVYWDYEKMKRALTIVLDNAFKYTPENGRITMDIHDHGKEVEICITDTGIGIEEKDINRIFDRFYRSENVRDGETDGSGIGLSILKSLSGILKFKIDVFSVPEKGSMFVLKIPKKMKI